MLSETPTPASMPAKAALGTRTILGLVPAAVREALAVEAQAAGVTLPQLVGWLCALRYTPGAPPPVPLQAPAPPLAVLPRPPSQRAKLIAARILRDQDRAARKAAEAALPPPPDGQQLAEWRARLGVSQRDLAALAGISRSTLAGVELGQRTAPPTRRRLAAVLARLEGGAA